MDESADIIAAIYDTILEPSRWDEVVGRIVTSTNSVSGSLAIRRTNSIQLAAMHNMDPLYLDAYAKNWFKNNPLDVFKESVSPGEIKAYTHITQTDTFMASAYYNEFVRPQRWSDGVIACLARGPSSSGYFGIIRSPNRIWVEPAEWKLLETVVPHLQRAIEVQQLLSRATMITDSLSAAFSAAGFGVYLVTKDCRILFCNAQAETLLRRCAGFRYSKGRLMATDHIIGERLRDLVRGGSRTQRGDNDGGGGGTLELRRNENGPPLIAHIIPLTAFRTFSILDIERPAAAVFVVDPSAELFARVRHFAARFGLTGAETRVLAEIIGGNTVLAAAENLKITEATVRTHLKRILMKTGATRQTGLIRLFFETSLPGVFPAP